MRSKRNGSMQQLLYQQDPIRSSVKSVGAKWTLLILRDIAFLKLNRFGGIRRNNPGLTARVLSRRLSEMQQEGLIERNVSRDAVTYNLTSRGEDAIFILLAFLRYGLKHYSKDKLVPSKPLPSLDDMIREYQQMPKAKPS